MDGVQCAAQANQSLADGIASKVMVRHEHLAGSSGLCHDSWVFTAAAVCPQGVVKKVEAGQLTLTDNTVIPFGLCIWSTGEEV